MLQVTVNSDDPAYFGGYMNDNFVAISQALDLSNAELKQLAINSFEASFISVEEKQKWIDQIQTLARQASTRTHLMHLSSKPVWNI